jgi:sulfate adenylyltransferase
LIAPYGSKLSVLYLSNEALEPERRRTIEYPSWSLTDRQICDVELLMNGAFSPLTEFMTRENYDRVVRDSGLVNGLVWTIPIVLDVNQQFGEKVTRGDRVALRDRKGMVVATMTIESKWTPDRELEARQVYGTSDTTHAGVFQLRHKTNPVYIGGPIIGIEPPAYYDFKHLRDDPAALRKKFRKRGWSRMVAFQTRNPMHPAHFELTRQAVKTTQANFLLHPVVGMSKPGDIDHYTRVRARTAALSRTNSDDEPAAPGDAARWTARGGMACHYPPQLRLLALHRRARPCRTRQWRRWRELLRSLCGTAVGPPLRRRTGD